MLKIINLLKNIFTGHEQPLTNEEAARQWEEIGLESQNAEEEFNKAIKSGRLSLDVNSERYAGNYMYMGKGYKGIAEFKHRDTRQYLDIPKKVGGVWPPVD